MAIKRNHERVTSFEIDFGGGTATANVLQYATDVQYNTTRETTERYYYGNNGQPTTITLSLTEEIVFTFDEWTEQANFVNALNIIRQSLNGDVTVNYAETNGITITNRSATLTSIEPSASAANEISGFNVTIRLNPDNTTP